MNDNWRDHISQPQYGVKTEKDVFVPMRDGVKLAVDVFRPDAPGKFPVLLAVGPWGKDAVEMPFSPQPLNKSAVWDGNLEAGDTNELVSRGYVHIVADGRGIGKSEGESFGGMTTQDGRDGYDLVEWAAAQPWSDGNVGMTGYSYYGGIQLKTAAEQPPHLRAIFPTHLVADYYRDAYAGGVLSLFQYGVFDGRCGTSGFAAKNVVSEMERKLAPAEFENRRKAALENPDIRAYPNLYHLLHYPFKNPQFFDILLNPLDGQYWRDRSVYPFYDRIKVPAYIIGKLARGSSYWDIYNGIEPTKKILVKPSGPEERPWREDLDLVFRWYDHWLKGKDTGLMNEPPIKMYITGINQYRFEKAWPLPGTEWTPCYLRRWEALSFAPELFQDEPDSYLQQPLHLSNKRDSVTYLSPPLSESMEAVGPASFKLYAAIDQDDTNWIVKLADVGPGGTVSPLGGGYLKASHRKLDSEKSTPWRPHTSHTSIDPVKPGEIYEYNIDLGSMANVFLPGHRIRLSIGSMESPRDPEIQIHYHPHLCSSRTTVHKIFRNRRYQSHLLLPLINKKPSLVSMMSDDNMF